MKRLKCFFVALVCVFVPIVFYACGGANARVTFNRPELVLILGEDAEISDIVRIENINPKDIVFEPSNLNVITISEGKIQSQNKGTSHLYAKNGNTVLAILVVKVMTKLPSPTNVRYDDTDNLLKWDRVSVDDGGEFFTPLKYIVSVERGNEVNKYETPTNSIRLTGEGDFVITVTAIGNNGINDSEPSSPFEMYYSRLEAAQDVSYNKASGKITWSAVENAHRYRVVVNGVENAFTSALEQNLTLTGLLTYRITVKAFDEEGGTRKSSESSPLVVLKLARPSVSVLGDEIYFWDDSSSHLLEYTLEDGIPIEEVINGPSFSLSGFDAGIYSIRVKTIAEGDNENIVDSDFSPSISVQKLAAPVVGYVSGANGRLKLQISAQGSEARSYAVTIGSSETQRFDNVESGDVIEIDLTATGEFNITVKALANYALPNGIQEADSNPSTPIIVMIHGPIEGVVHEIYSGQSKLSFNKVSEASGYLISVNDSVLSNLTKEETEEKVVFTLGDTDSLINDGKIMIEIVTLAGGNYVSSSYERELIVLGNPTDLQLEEGQFTFKSIEGARGYRYEIYRTAYDFEEAGIEPIAFEEITDASFEYVFGYGYYVVKVFAIGDDNNWVIESRRAARLELTIQEQLALPQFSPVYNQIEGKYTLFFSNDENGIAYYKVKIDEVEQTHGLIGQAYFFDEGVTFDDTNKEYKIEIIAVSSDTNILLSSNPSTITLIRQAAPAINVMEDERVEVTPPENAAGYIAFVGGTKFESGAIDLSSFGGEFSLQIRSKAGEPSEGVHYLDSLVIEYNFSRIVTPQNLKYDSGTISFEHNVDDGNYEFYLTATTASGQKKSMTITGVFTNNGVGELLLNKSSGVISFGYADLIILAKNSLDSGFLTFFSNRTALTLSVRALKSKNTYEFSSFKAMLSNGLENELNIQELSAPVIAFTKVVEVQGEPTKTNVLSWNNVIDGASYEVYKINDDGDILLDTVGGTSFMLTSSIFEAGNIEGFYVLATYPKRPASKKSNSINIKKLGTIAQITVGDDKVTVIVPNNSQNDYSGVKLEWDDLNGERSETAVQDSKDFSLRDSGLYKFTLVSAYVRDEEPSTRDGVDINGIMTYYIDGDASFFTIRDLEGANQNPEGALADEKINWNTIINDNWNASIAGALSYTIEVYSFGGTSYDTLVEERKGITSTSYPLKEFRDLAAGSYRFSVWAVISSYTLNMGETGYAYRASVFNEGVSVKKLAEVTDLKVETKESSLLLTFIDERDKTTYEVKVGEIVLELSFSDTGSGRKEGTLSRDNFKEGTNILSVIAHESNAIPSSETKVTVTKAANIVNITVNDLGDVSIDAPIAADSYLIQVEVEDKEKKYSLYTNSNPFNLFTLIQMNEFEPLIAGEVTLTIKAAAADNFLPSDNSFEKKVTYLNRPIVSLNSNKILFSLSGEDVLITYRLEFSNGEPAQYVSSNTFDLPESWTGKVIVTVYAMKEGAITSAAAEIEVTIQRLDSVADVKYQRNGNSAIDDYLVSWSEVSGATGYILRIAGPSGFSKENSTTNTSYNLKEFKMTAAGDYVLTVIAYGDDIMNSSEFKINLNKPAKDITNYSITVLGELKFQGSGGNYIVLGEHDGTIYGELLEGRYSTFFNFDISGQINFKIIKAGSSNLNESPVTNGGNLTIDSETFEIELEKLVGISNTQIDSGYVTFLYNETYREEKFLAIYNGQAKEFIPNGIEINSYRYKLTGFIELFEIYGALSKFELELRVVSRGCLGSFNKGVPDIAFEVLGSLDASKQRGNNLAEEFITIVRDDINDKYTHFLFTVMADGEEYEELYATSSISGFWITKEDGYKTFSKIQNDNADYTNVKVYGIDLSEFIEKWLPSSALSFTFSISALVHNAKVTIASRSEVLERLSSISSVSLESTSENGSGNLKWNSVTGAMGYYVFLTSLSGTQIEYTTSLSMNLSDCTATERMYEVSVSAVSTTKIFSRQSFLMKEGGKLEVIKLAAPEVPKLSYSGYEGSLVWSDDNNGFNSDLDLFNLAASVASGKIYYSPFTYTIDNLLDVKVALRISGGGRVYYKTVNAIELLRLNSSEAQFIKNNYSSLALINSSLAKKLKDIIEENGYGLANTVKLPNEILEGIPSGDYTLQIRQLGNSSLGWIGSSFSDAEAFYIGETPDVQTSKIGDEYFLSFAPKSIKNVSEGIVDANNYTLVFVSESLREVYNIYKDGADWKVAAPGSEEFTLTYENGRIYINVSQYIKSSFSGVFMAHIFTNGNGKTINSKSAPVTVRFLTPPQVDMVKGFLQWQTQDVFTKVEYTFNSVGTQLLLEGSALKAWEMDGFTSGEYRNVKFTAIGSSSKYSMIVDSDPITLGTIYKLNAPTVETNFGYFEIENTNVSYSNLADSAKLEISYVVHSIVEKNNSKYPTEIVGNPTITKYEAGNNTELVQDNSVTIGEKDTEAKEFSVQARGTSDKTFGVHTFTPYVNSNENVMRAQMMGLVQNVHINFKGELEWNAVSLSGTYSNYYSVFYKLTVQSISSSPGSDGSAEKQEVVYTKETSYDLRDISFVGKMNVIIQALLLKTDDHKEDSTAVDTDGETISGKGSVYNDSTYNIKVLLGARQETSVYRLEEVSIYNENDPSTETYNIKIVDGIVEFTWYLSEDATIAGSSFQTTPGGYLIKFVFGSEERIYVINGIARDDSINNNKDEIDNIVSYPTKNVVRWWINDNELIGNLEMYVYAIPNEESKPSYPSTFVIKSPASKYNGKTFETADDNAALLAVVAGEMRTDNLKVEFDGEKHVLDWLKYESINTYSGKIKEYIFGYRIDTDSLIGKWQTSKITVPYVNIYTTVPNEKIEGEIEPSSDESSLNIYLGNRVLYYYIQAVPNNDEFMGKLMSPYSEVGNPLQVPEKIGEITWESASQKFSWKYTNEVPVTYVIKNVMLDNSDNEIVNTERTYKIIQEAKAEGDLITIVDVEFMPPRIGKNKIKVAVLIGTTSLNLLSEFAEKIGTFNLFNTNDSTQSIEGGKEYVNLPADGSEESPYLISSSIEFTNINLRSEKPGYLKSYEIASGATVQELGEFIFKQVKDLSLGTGNQITKFNGVYDGNSKDITYEPEGINEITLSSLGLSNVSIGSIVGTSYYTQGIGLFIKSTGIIRNIKINVTYEGIFTKNALVGGLMLFNEGTVEGCVLKSMNVQNLTWGASTILMMGGLVAYNTGTILDSQNTSTFEKDLPGGGSYNLAFAGICAINHGGTIKGGVHSGTIGLTNRNNTTNSNLYAAGIVVENINGKIYESLNSGEVTADGSVASYSYAGGIAYYSSNSSVVSITTAPGMNNYSGIAYSINIGTVVSGTGAGGIAYRFNSSHACKNVGASKVTVNKVSTTSYAFADKILNNTNGASNYQVGSFSHTGVDWLTTLTQELEIYCEYSGTDSVRKIDVTKDGEVYSATFQNVTT